MAWQIDDVRIFVVEKQSDYKQIIARLQPVNAGTVYHIFGYEKAIFKISAYVVGDADAADIVSMYSDGLTHVFSGPVGFSDFYVNSVTLKDQKSISQSLRPDLACDANVYIVDLELYQNV